ncbi:hypothetical protein ACVWZW_002170 [Bradyrhizobium sp. F1.13.4]
MSADGEALLAAGAVAGRDRRGRQRVRRHDLGGIGGCELYHGLRRRSRSNLAGDWCRVRRNLRRERRFGRQDQHWVGRGELDGRSWRLGRCRFSGDRAWCRSDGGRDIGGQGDAVLDGRSVRDVCEVKPAEILRARDGRSIGAAVLDEGRGIGGQRERQPAGENRRGAGDRHQKRPPIIHDPCLQTVLSNLVFSEQS